MRTGIDHGEWFFRQQKDFDACTMYGKNPSFFTIKLNHGGEFSNFPDTTYERGKIDFIDMVDSDRFSVIEVFDMVQKLGYQKEDVIRFHFKVPGDELDFGLKPLANDKDVCNLLKHVKKYKIIEVYVEHKMNEEDYDMDDEEDYDFIVDEDNLIYDVDVDMDEFRAAVDCEDENITDDENDNMSDFELDDFDCVSESNDEPPLQIALKNIRKQKKKEGQTGDCPFYLGQAFASRNDIMPMVKKHAIESRRQLYILRNDKCRFRVVCLGKNPNLVMCESNEVGKKQCVGGGSQQINSSKSTKSKLKKKIPTPSCPWLLHISYHKKEGSWVVKTFFKEHQCLQTRDVKLFTISWLAKEIEPTVRVNPEIPLKALQDMLQQKFQVQVTSNKIFRAKAIATKWLQGDYKGQYEKLNDYCDELIRCNPGTTIKIDVEREPNPNSPTRQFRRIYICLGGLKKGFKICERELLGLDGCFMKGPYPGQILTAVGVDANNGIYPVAYAVVESESANSWVWFLQCLGDDLDIYSNSNFTFISDRQKGIIPAICKVFPNAEHRYCLRHIHENMKQKWKGQLFKEMLWMCASATTTQGFDKAMKEVLKQDKAAHDWLKQIPPRHWSRAYFNGRSKCDVLLNNLCEVFNKQLVGGRDKPIITCLEFIREYIMKRIVVVRKMIAKCNGPLTPVVTKIFEKIKSDASNYTVIWNGVSKYQVSGSEHDQCVVILNQRSCTCRKWELTGIPCKHAVACIWNMAMHGIGDGIAEQWVDEIYWLETWKKIYENTVDPINGKNLWIPSQRPTTLIPPKHHIQVGRPSKKRKKSIEELSQLRQSVATSGKMPRKGNTVTCDNCKKMGHNKRTCKEQRQGTQNGSQVA